MSQSIGSYHAPDTRRALPHSTATDGDKFHLRRLKWRDIRCRRFFWGGGVGFPRQFRAAPTSRCKEKPSTSAAGFQTSWLPLARFLKLVARVACLFRLSNNLLLLTSALIPLQQHSEPHLPSPQHGIRTAAFLARGPNRPRNRRNARHWPIHGPRPRRSRSRHPPRPGTYPTPFLHPLHQLTTPLPARHQQPNHSPKDRIPRPQSHNLHSRPLLQVLHHRPDPHHPSRRPQNPHSAKLRRHPKATPRAPIPRRRLGRRPASKPDLRLPTLPRRRRTHAISARRPAPRSPRKHHKRCIPPNLPRRDYGAGVCGE